MIIRREISGNIIAFVLVFFAALVSLTTLTKVCCFAISFIL